MRATSAVLALSLLVGACAITGTESEQELLFSAADGPAEDGVQRWEPHEGLGFGVEFMCPGKAHSMMISPLIPLPPLIPAGFLNTRLTYLLLHQAAGESAPVASMHFALAGGRTIRLKEAEVFALNQASPAGLTTTLQFDMDCAEFDGAELHIEALEYPDKTLLPTKAKLQFRSRLKVSGGYMRS